MPSYKVVGEKNTKEGWKSASVVIHNCGNIQVAKVRATEYMHKIKRTERI